MRESGAQKCPQRTTCLTNKQSPSPHSQQEAAEPVELSVSLEELKGEVWH